MSSQRESRSSDADRSWLSAAADGDASALGRLAGCWRDDAQARADWQFEAGEQTNRCHPAQRKHAALDAQAVGVPPEVLVLRAGVVAAQLAIAAETDVVAA